MTETQTNKTEAAEEKDFVARLADAGEEALHRLTELPGGQRALNAMNDLRARVDDLAKKVRGIDALEERVSKLEKEVATLKRAKSSSARKPSA
jgi:polyhydroxyalkanoate synthesis regulator phasin